MQSPVSNNPKTLDHHRDHPHLLCVPAAGIQGTNGLPPAIAGNFSDIQGNGHVQFSAAPLSRPKNVYGICGFDKPFFDTRSYCEVDQLTYFTFLEKNHMLKSQRVTQF